MVLENQQTELGGFTLYKFKAPGGHTQTSLASINKILSPKTVINEKVTSLKLPPSLQKVVPSSRTFKSISTIHPSELVDFPINLFH